MLLELDSKHRVTVDSSCQNFQLEQLQEITDKKTKETKHEFKIIGYHGLSLRSALLQYKNHAIAISDIETTNELIDRLNELEKSICKTVKNVKDDIKLVSNND